MLTVLHFLASSSIRDLHLFFCVWNILAPLTPMVWHVRIYHALMIKHPVVIPTLSLVSYYCMFSHCFIVDLLYQAVTT